MVHLLDPLDGPDDQGKLFVYRLFYTRMMLAPKLKRVVLENTLAKPNSSHPYYTSSWAQ
jgi:hypothetical protein